MRRNNGRFALLLLYFEFTKSSAYVTWVGTQPQEQNPTLVLMEVCSTVSSPYPLPGNWSPTLDSKGAPTGVLPLLQLVCPFHAGHYKLHVRTTRHSRSFKQQPRVVPFFGMLVEQASNGFGEHVHSIDCRRETSATCMPLQQTESAPPPSGIHSIEQRGRQPAQGNKNQK